LSGFTENYKGLLIGTNLGGLGTLIASMASLISFKQIAKSYHEQRGKYFLLFTIMNLVFLAILWAFHLILA
ncbi:MAG: citrate transporter, partial [Treponema sp.]|nr:citrate transporter [Treponema sp.]